MLRMHQNNSDIPCLWVRVCMCVCVWGGHVRGFCFYPDVEILREHPHKDTNQIYPIFWHGVKKETFLAFLCVFFLLRKTLALQFSRLLSEVTFLSKAYQQNLICCSWWLISLLIGVLTVLGFELDELWLTKISFLSGLITVKQKIIH